MSRVLPVLTVLLAILLVWYAAAVMLNRAWVMDQAARAGTPVSMGQVLRETMVQDRPVLPAPHQVARGLWDGVAGQKITSKRSLVWHAGVTLSATLAGFALGTAAGLLLASIAQPHEPSQSLDAIAARLGIAITARHNAAGDALATAQVFLALLPLLRQRGIVSLGEARAAAEMSYYARLRY